jgi:hypothetical protein
MPMKNALFFRMRSFELVMQFVLMQRTAKKDRKAKTESLCVSEMRLLLLGAEHRGTNV